MSSIPETRYSLISGLKRQDHEAWAEFVRLYQPLLYRLGKKKGLQDADTLDLIQEVFTVVGRAIGRFEPDRKRGSFWQWLNRITRNLMINLLTRQKGPRGSGDSSIRELLHQQADATGDAGTWVHWEYRRALFRMAVEKIRPQFQPTTWDAFWLTAVEGVSNMEAAQRLQKSPGAIRIGRCRVLAKLKDEVSRIEVDD